VNALGKTTQELVGIRTAFASIRATGGTESYEAERLNNTVTYDVRTRYDASLLDPTLVILWNGRRFEIRSVIDVREEQRELAFTCREILKAGDDHVRHDLFDY
jgi:SPP1 family predicted phage head-tail adaptor